MLARAAVTSALDRSVRGTQDDVSRFHRTYALIAYDSPLQIAFFGRGFRDVMQERALDILADLVLIYFNNVQ